jgi:hypothetical protein
MPSVKATVEPITQELKWWLLLVILYALLIVVLPANGLTMHNYDLSVTEYKILRLAVALPTFAVWAAAFWGTAKLRQYTQSIRDTAEGEGFGLLARGCMWLAWSLPIPVFTSFLLGSLAASHPGFNAFSVIVTNYVSLLLPLIAFVIIGGAARNITGGGRLNLATGGGRVLTFIFLVAGVLYCYLTFSKFDLGSLGSSNNPYFLPIWLMVITLIVPHLYAWFTGLLATYELAHFAKDGRGVLYRRALWYIAIGIILVIASLIAVQYLTSIRPRSYQFSLDIRLLVTLAFRMIGGAGFVLLGLGAIKLKRIEDV